MAANLDLQAITAIVAVIAAVVAVCIYYIGGDRKSKSNGSRLPMPPGPRPWPIVGNLGLMGGLLHQTLARLAKQYGPIMLLRLGSVPLIVVSSPSFAELILKTHDKVFASRPTLSQGKYLGYDFQSVFYAPYGPHWRRMRKVFMDIFTSKGSQQFQTVRKEAVLGTLHSILDESKAGGAAHMDVMFHSMSSSIITRMMIRSKPNSSVTVSNMGQEGECMKTVRELITLGGSFVTGDYIPLLRNFDPQGYIKKMQAAQGKLGEMLGGIIQERRQSFLSPSECSPPGQTDALDVVDLLLTRPSSADDKPLTDDQIKAVLEEFWLGGIETTSNTLQWTMAELVKNPIMLKRAQEELDRVVGQDRLVEESDIPHLHYLQAVVKESLRLHPVVPVIPHAAVEACEMAGYYIPSKAFLFVNVWAIGRDPSVWDRPLEFSPERFLGKNLEIDDVAEQEFKWLPFGTGRRTCPGKSLGQTVVQYTLAVLLHACDWSLAQGMTPENMDLNNSEAVGITLPMAAPLQVDNVATSRLPHSVIYAHQQAS